MRHCLLFFVFFVTAEQSLAQQKVIDSLRTLISKKIADTTRVRLLQELAETYRVSPDIKNQDSAISYSDQSLLMARDINDKRGEIRSLVILAKSIRNETNPVKAIEYYKQALLLSEEIKDTSGIIAGLNGYALIYYYKSDFRQELSYYWKVEKLARKINDRVELKKAFRNIGNTLLRLDQPDSAETYIQKSMQLDTNGEDPLPFAVMGRIRLYQHDYGNALQYFRQALLRYERKNDKLGISQSYYDFARINEEQQKWDSALYNYKISYDQGILDADSLYVKVGLSPLIATLYEKVNNLPEALRYYKIFIKANDRANENETLTKLLNFEFQEKERIRELALSKQEYKNKIKFYIAIGGVIILALTGFLLYRNNRQKQKAKTQIEKAFSELKSTQTQLIQSEKMASLGELTAGIAHEIQNPLNFVNNFSDVNTELIDELKTELATGNQQQAIEIADNIRDNEEKINHHGKRADAIVKGMLQHSRSSSGIKEPTDINKLADEYLRLAYHGLRAKDKSFNATMKTDYDESIGNINIVPQDIGRVILNLITNAFYAASLPSKGGFKDPNHKHEPAVWVKTSKNPPPVDGGRGGEVLISVRDNGPGIPQNIIDKIFQPFFTTKPTGQGTGLGLSLSYDIVKTHGGELKVKTEEGEGTTFIIILPT
jgi:two-component system, NtrC family, sensor kinase